MAHTSMAGRWVLQSALRESLKVLGRGCHNGVGSVRRTVFFVGVIILVLGAILIAYGQISRGQIEGLATARDWAVTWYHVTDQFGGWGSSMGTDTFHPNFHLTSVSYSGETLHLGFKATTTIDLMQDATITFVIGSDDGSLLYVDDRDVGLNMWVTQAYRTMSADVPLTSGTHKLEMQYYQWEGGSEVSFELRLPGWQTSVNMMIGGGFLLVLGAIITIIGRVLKPSKEKASAEKAEGQPA
jgi:hypothetical protein